MRKITFLGLLMAFASLGMGPANAVSDPHGCVAYVPLYNCFFIGDANGVPSGVISASTNDWRVTHQDSLGNTVVDLSGSGPGAVSYVFTTGVVYHVSGDAVVAGSPEPTLAQGSCGEVDVQVDQNACGNTLAVSATGDASGSGCTDPVSCVAVSGTGSASNTGGAESYGGIGSCGRGEGRVAAGCVAVSGTGSASNTGSCGYSFVGAAAGCVAVSGTGDASNATPHGCGGMNFYGAAAGCVAVSGTGNATNTKSDSGCGSSGSLGVAAGCVAVSGTGNATNNSALGWGCGAGNTASGAVGCVAVSGAGQATNNATTNNGGGACGSVGYASPGLMVGCVAVGGGGASNNVTGSGPSCGYPPDPATTAQRIATAAQEGDIVNVVFIILFDTPGVNIGCVAVSPPGS